MSAVTGSIYRADYYGAVELQAAYQRNMCVALALAVVMHFGLIGSYYWAGFESGVREVPDGGGSSSGNGTEVEILVLQPPQPSVGTPEIKHTKATILDDGFPVPVKNEIVSEENTLPEQGVLNPFDQGTIGAGGPGENGIGEDIATIEIEQPPDIFVVVEKYPVVIKWVKPKYPDLAIRASLEGRVVVNVWVDKVGRARKAVVLTSDYEIFNDPAIEAAMQFAFVPAYMNNGPVSVWVSIPFSFTLVK